MKTLQYKSAWTEELYNTWFRPDMKFFIQEERDGYRIIPNENKCYEIDFTIIYKNFDDAVEKMTQL